MATITQAVLDSYGYSEADLAKVLDISQPTVHRIKTGQSKNPGFFTGKRLQDLYESRPSPNAAA